VLILGATMVLALAVIRRRIKDWDMCEPPDDDVPD
jgi:hypothetical protein